MEIGHKKRGYGRRIAEEYLEAIYELTRENRRVRPIDISRTLNVAPSTVRKVLKRLIREGYVSYEPYRRITLTPQGERYILILKQRHDAVSKLFKLLGMPPLEAEVEAEKIEHNMTALSTQFFQALVEALEETPSLLTILREKVSEKIDMARS